MKKILLITLSTILLLSAAIGLVSCAAMGSSPMKEQADMYRSSANYQDDSFINATPVSMDMDTDENMFSFTMRFFMDTSRKPKRILPTSPITAADFSETPEDLQVVWLGHSSTIVDIDGIRVMVDPVFGNASPVPFTVNRFQDSPISRDDLPKLDAVLISHDHYDHLEMKTIKELIDRVPLFIVPLGVGAHLEKWGCPANQIVELDWWQEYTINGVTITATPSRHFSGRGLNDRFKTLWASFAIKGPEHSVFYSGDGGYDLRFEEIGKRLGPFDLTMIETGAWDKAWPDVHLFPQQAVNAHMKLGGKYMLPVHWAAYDLAFHNWDEPIRNVSQYASDNGVTLLTPRMGEISIPGKTQHDTWWVEPDTDV